MTFPLNLHLHGISQLAMWLITEGYHDLSNVGFLVVVDQRFWRICPVHISATSCRPHGRSEAVDFRRAGADCAGAGFSTVPSRAVAEKRGSRNRLGGSPGFVWKMWENMWNQDPVQLEGFAINLGFVEMDSWGFLHIIYFLLIRYDRPGNAVQETIPIPIRTLASNVHHGGGQESHQGKSSHHRYPLI